MTDEEIGKEAAKTARARTLELLDQYGPSLDVTLRRLKQALNAKLTKAHYDSDSGEWAYSKNLADNTTRLKAVELSLTLYDAFPSKKHDLTTNGQPVTFIMNLTGKKDE